MSFIRPSVLVAMVAMALVVCPSASAVNFEAEEFPADLHGEAEEGAVLTVEGKVTCEGATFAGELSESAETVSLAPSYTGCTAFGLGATIGANGCEFLLHVGEETSSTSFDGAVDLVCPAGKSLAVTFGNCEVQIGSQSGLVSLGYTNHPEAAPPSFSMQTALTGIEYSKTKDGFLCPLSGTGVKTDGTYAGSVSVEGAWKELPVGVLIGPLFGQTRLCGDKPDCAPANALAAGTEFEATVSPPKSTQILILEGAVAKNAVVCEESEAKAKNKQKEATPLTMEGFSVTFGKCKTVGNTGCGKVQMENAPADAKLFGAAAGNGALSAPVTLRVQCKGELDCEYSTNQMAMAIKGGNQAQLLVADVLAKKKIGGEEGCFDAASWAGTYLVQQPNPLWVGG